MPLEFNLAHTRGLVACAVALGRDVGVDVEWLGRRGRTLEIAERYFSPSEVRDLRATPGPDRKERFFRYWTLKEAYVKARGEGLRLPLRRFSFHLDGPAVRVSFESDSDDPRAWQFLIECPTPSHLLAVAVRRASNDAVRFRS